jgi:alkylation response protein AidB-like acyl-CoA dehydrogenase
VDLTLSQDQELFQETAARFLADTMSLDAVRALEDDPAGFDREWWRQSAELGWTSILAPTDLGGGGISDEGLRDLALVAYERGRMVSPGPLVPTNVVIAALAESPNRSASFDETLSGLMSGDLIGAIAIEEAVPTWGPSGGSTTAEFIDDRLVLNGTKSPVEAAAEADVFVVSALGSAGVVLVSVPADTPGVSVQRRGNVDLVRRFGSLHLDNVSVPASCVVATGDAAVHRCLDIANVLQMAETVGAIDRVFEFTLEWAFDRHTFGRPLASYQELKHRFADMKLWLEASKATVVSAASAVARDESNASELVSAAKSYVSEHAPELVQDCVQMHGGIGVTWDHDIHLYLRRVTLNSSTYGTARDHRERLAAMILDGV